MQWTGQIYIYKILKGYGYKKYLKVTEYRLHIFWWILSEFKLTKVYIVGIEATCMYLVLVRSWLDIVSDNLGNILNSNGW